MSPPYPSRLEPAHQGDNMADLINLTEHLAQGGYNYAFGISAIDLTGNGVPDLVTPDTEVGLYWLENDG